MADAVTCTLPSAQSACRVVQGDMSAIPTVLLHMLGRATIIGFGCYAAGFRGRDLVTASLAGAAAIEVAVLLYTTTQVRHAEAQPTPEPEPVASGVQRPRLRRRLQHQRNRVGVGRIGASSGDATCCCS